MLLALLINFLNHPDVESAISIESVVSQRAIPTEQPASKSVLPETSVNEAVPSDSGQ